MTVELFVDDSGGSGRPLVFINSIGLAGSMWEPQVQSAPPRVRAVTYDQRGHGRSPAVPPSSLADLRDDLIGVLDRLELGRVDLCGLSLGGMVALSAASHHPERIGRLVVACTSAIPGDPAKWRQRAATVRDVGMVEFVRGSQRGWFTPEFSFAHPELVRKLERDLSDTDAACYSACCEIIEGLDISHELSSIVSPTLVLAGAEDRGFPLSHAELITAGIRGARLRVIHDAAHLANLEKPGDFTAELFAFLSTTSGLG